ncbi:hypothetical protein GW926_00085, partial [Candidatus Pacearchaeota archaeon]|nr:hypothetical protein [Candidatus Pacearchaeota archaeon]
MKNQKPLNIEMIITNRRQMVIAVLLGVVSFGLILFAIVPQFREFLSLKSELDNETPRLVKLKQKLV